MNLKIRRIQSKKCARYIRLIVEAIDRLQGSNNTFYGEFLPQLMRMKKIVTTLQLRHLKFCSHWFLFC
ncbi:hypothetical protein RN001_012368 [Aquatica leii]|uniref:Uncharacterized protein n=1 Tax=Aquatica leii TaxID=1421715 RepID=A0AAN7P773_9COLE|nr:hypothetical protein RN001_012368 [Aquatica leii]